VGCALDYWSRWYGVDRHLVRGLAWQESGWTAWIVSSAGARGPLQVLPATRDYVQTYLIGRPVAWTPSGDIRIGVAYLHHLLQTLAGNERLAVAAYYQGPSAVWRHGVLPATEQYVANVLALRDRM